jgi:murein L,D-transpeptidase YafK
MKRIALLALVSLAMTGPVRSSVPDSRSGLPLVDRIVVEKAFRRLTLYSGRHVVRTINGIQLGGEPVGHKRFQGDERTPEGRYSIDYGNPRSSYHLSLRISYPNGADVAYAEYMGRDPGGMIMIHGQPNGMRGRMRGDWTDGCIALSNREIEYLWQTVPDGTVIDLLP